tara:strand:- start:4707 stop:4976 length:270 start_codon:yes stop_codon:yes gene_type:complete
LKKHGNESSADEQQALEDFFTAAKMMAVIIEEFESQEMQAGAAISGALTQLLSHLISVSPDVPAAMGLLSSCMTKAALQFRNPTDDIVH